LVTLLKFSVKAACAGMIVAPSMIRLKSQFFICVLLRVYKLFQERPNTNDLDAIPWPFLIVGCIILNLLIGKVIFMALDCSPTGSIPRNPKVWHIAPAILICSLTRVLSPGRLPAHWNRFGVRHPAWFAPVPAGRLWHMP